MKSIDTEEQLLEMIRANRSHLLFLFKHSTSCPVSGQAFNDFQKFAENHPDIDCAYIDIWKHRNISNLLEQESHIKHESPQVLLYQNGKVKWSASHYAINQKALESHVKT